MSESYWGSADFRPPISWGRVCPPDLLDWVIRVCDIHVDSYGGSHNPMALTSGPVQVEGPTAPHPPFPAPPRTRAGGGPGQPSRPGAWLALALPRRQRTAWGLVVGQGSVLLPAHRGVLDVQEVGAELL